jgi:lysylphosphatidylglycerol synthetase-like protein (DUF2156 family)
LLGGLYGWVDKSIGCDLFWSGLVKNHKERIPFLKRSISVPNIRMSTVLKAILGLTLLYCFAAFLSGFMEGAWPFLTNPQLWRALFS